MEKNAILWIGIFFLLCIVEVSAETFGYQSVIYFTKPFLMPVLAGWLAHRTSGVRRFLRQTLIVALIFATIGDILLMIPGGAYSTLLFLLGLGAFLCTHLWYISGFLMEVDPRRGYLRTHFLWVAPFLVYLLAFLSWLWPDMPEGMQFPVTVYAVIISTMALSVINMHGRIQKDAFLYLLTGALLFILSDSLIAAQKFGHPFPGNRVVIMVTYLLGQWLIVRGASIHLRWVPEK